MSGADDNFLSRWSRRKIDARKGQPQADAPEPPRVAKPASARQSDVLPAETAIPLEAKAVVDLPSVDSLTLDSDFTPFMQPGVDPMLRRAALKKLVRDPRFNVMDGLDVYIDDYSKADPLPEGWLDKLNVMKQLGHCLEPEEGDAKPLPEAIEAPPIEPGSPPASTANSVAQSSDSK
jgi:hypothetical protein